jgi:hypothetical protein
VIPLFQAYLHIIFLSYQASLVYNPKEFLGVITKLAPLPGKQNLSYAFLGYETEMIFDDRQRLDILLVLIIYLVTPQVHPGS